MSRGRVSPRAMSLFVLGLCASVGGCRGQPAGSASDGAGGGAEGGAAGEGAGGEGGAAGASDPANGGEAGGGGGGGGGVPPAADGLLLDLSREPRCSLYASTKEVEEKLFRPSCAQPSCHSKGAGETKPEFPPDLEREDAGMVMLNAPVDFNSQCGGNLKIIDGEDPDASFLLLKVASAASPSCGVGTAAGERMPQNQDEALTSAELECVRWYVHQVAGAEVKPPVDAGPPGPGPGKTPDPQYLKVQPILTRSCALSGCHKNGPSCPDGKPIDPNATSHLDCADPNQQGTIIGLDLSSARGIERTAIGVDAFHAVLLRTCGKWLNDVEPKMRVGENARIKRIVPGDPKNSYVMMKLRKVTEAYLADQGRTLRDPDRGQDNDVTRCHGFLMPRSEAVKKDPSVELSDADVETLRAWIAAGARLWSE